MNKSDCKNILNLIPLYIDDMLSEDENDILCDHINKCNSCRKELEFFKAIKANTEQLPEIEVPLDFHENVMKKIKAEPQLKSNDVITPVIVYGGAEHAPRKRLWHKYITGFVASAAVIALSVVSLVNIDKSRSVENLDELIPPVMSSAPAHVEENAPTPNDITLAESNEYKPSNLEKISDSSEKTAGSEEEKTNESHRSNNDSRLKETPESNAQPDNEVSKKEEVVESLNEKDSETSDSEHKTGENEPEVQSNSEPVSPVSVYSGGEMPVGRSVKTFRVFYVTLSEDIREKAEEILKGLSHDEIGYISTDNTEELINTLLNLEGVSVSSETDEEITTDYIVLK